MTHDNPADSGPLRRLARELAGEARAWTTFPEAAIIADRLDAAEACWGATEAETSDRPLVFAFLGASGVGKSSLFNALLGLEASPTSDGERNFTKEPHVAVSRRVRPAMGFLDHLHPVWCEGIDADLPNVLIDTPDIDGVNLDNRESARAVVREADVIVFVTDPDRRATLRTLEELRAWAGLKLWLFVLNKADQYPDREAVAHDWDVRLREKGFEPSSDNRMLVSVVGPDHGDLERLRDLLFQPWKPLDLATLRRRNVLGRYKHALAKELVQPIRDVHAELQRLEHEQVVRVRVAYQAGLQGREATQALWSYVRNRTWLEMTARPTGLLAPAIHLRARFAPIARSFAVARMTRGSLLGLAAAAGMGMLESLRGLAGLKRVLDLMAPETRDALREIRRTVRHQLEDRRLDGLAEPPASEQGSSTETPAYSPSLRAGPLRLDLPSQASMMGTLQRLGLALPQDDEVLNELHEHTERIAVTAAGRAARCPWVVLGNLLPVAALSHILFRLGRSWFLADYLPLPFYPMAAGILAASCIPGFLLISARVASQTRRIDLDDLVSRIEQPAVIRPITRVRQRLGAFLRLADGLDRQVHQLREDLRRQQDALPFAAPDADQAADAPWNGTAVMSQGG